LFFILRKCLIDDEEKLLFTASGDSPFSNAQYTYSGLPVIQAGLFSSKSGISGEKGDNTRSRKFTENRLVIQRRIITLKQELPAITKAIGNDKTEVVTLVK
jgi:hypothetical protein